ncbi:MAG: ABC transporter permease [Desulfomonile tiedjei]|uniref:ABC transporter permease n=1 Tax=Desulfomonile tiedjei TaxID=2358 RepID=A0A9D6VB57_9BACT|nr:ABC transporter permease [Desulfomonile tiedjei]
MLAYIIRRMLIMIPTLIAISIISFTIIQLPPGDFLTTYVAQLSASGEGIDQAELDALRHRFGLDQPIYVQYFQWVWNFVRGDFGHSFEWNKPVRSLIGERIALTILISTCTLLFTWIVSLPIGIYSAVRQYSWMDYFLTFFGFIGLATPNFLFALILLWFSYAYLGMSIGGLFSPQFIEAPWSFAKFIDLLKHLWIPVLIVGTGHTAKFIRIIRGNLLDELKKPYVTTARAKGLSETKLILKYPVRVAINPLVSTIGWTLPELISGIAITAVVLNLPTSGPLLLSALMSQDMHLAGSFIMILSILTVIGTLISDILLAWVDPRIRFGARESA